MSASIYSCTSDGERWRSRKRATDDAAPVLVAILPHGVDVEKPCSEEESVPTLPNSKRSQLGNDVGRRVRESANGSAFPDN